MSLTTDTLDDALMQALTDWQVAHSATMTAQSSRNSACDRLRAAEREFADAQRAETITMSILRDAMKAMVQAEQEASAAACSVGESVGAGTIVRCELGVTETGRQDSLDVESPDVSDTIRRRRGRPAKAVANV